MKLRSAPLDDIFNEFSYVLGARSDLESRIMLVLGRRLYRLARTFMLAALRRTACRRFGL